MYNDPKGPIEHFSWGKYIISGKEHATTKKGVTGSGKDIRLIGNEVSRWNERVGHELTSSMITGVYGKDIDILIVGIGVKGDITYSGELPGTISKKGISRVMFERTRDACETYNRLYHEGKRVALLSHGTC